MLLLVQTLRYDYPIFTINKCMSSILKYISLNIAELSLQRSGYFYAINIQSNVFRNTKFQDLLVYNFVNTSSVSAYFSDCSKNVPMLKI